MRHTRSNLAVVFLLLTSFAACAEEADTDVLHGPYFGQTPPGQTPQIFAPGIVSTSANEGCILFTRDGLHVLFRQQGFTNLFFEGEDLDAGWRITRIAPPFERLDWRNGDFTIAPNGTTVFFTSRRPLEDGNEQGDDSSLWTVEWNGTSWSTPSAVPPPVRGPEFQAYASATNDGTIYYFAGVPGKADFDLYRSERSTDGYSAPELLDAPLNTDAHEWDPYVAPDESYLIFMSHNRPDGLNQGDLFISFRNEADEWSEPVLLGDSISTTANENRPFVSLDGRYFFFNSDRDASGPELEELRPDLRPGNGSGDIYWVDASVLERYRPTR